MPNRKSTSIGVPFKEGARVWYYTPYKQVANSGCGESEQANAIDAGVRKGGFWAPGGVIVMPLSNGEYLVEVMAGYDAHEKRFSNARRVFRRAELKTKASRQLSA